jgi:hypothetical protein
VWTDACAVVLCAQWAKTLKLLVATWLWRRRRRLLFVLVAVAAPAAVVVEVVSDDSIVEGFCGKSYEKRHPIV